MMKKGKYELAEFIQAINSLADELPDEMCLMIKDSLGSMTLRTAKMVLDAIGVPSTVLSDQESYDALISAAFSAIVEKSFCRKLITKDLEKSLKNISEMTFREFDCKFLYIRCPMLLKLMDIENGSDDGVIAFAYLDYQAGISFDIIGTAHIFDNNLSISDVDKSTRRKIRHGFFDRMPMVKVLDLIDTNISLDDFYCEVGAHEIYYRNLDSDIEALRSNTDLDTSRHPSFPDDIQIQLVKDGRIVEAPWARCSKLDRDTGFMYAKLINEPHNEFGFHMDDEIPFKVIEAADGNLLCINLEHYNQ